MIGSAVSLAYYLRVIAAVWMRGPSESAAGLVGAGTARPAIAGGSAEADAEAVAAGRTPGTVAARVLRQPEVIFVAVVCAAATIAFGIYPEPLLNVARDAGDAIKSLI